LLGQQFPAILLVESEYRLALLNAELDFVTELVRRITEEGWGPVDLWCNIQATCERDYRARAARHRETTHRSDEHAVGSIEE